MDAVLASEKGASGNFVKGGYGERGKNWKERGGGVSAVYLSAVAAETDWQVLYCLLLRFGSDDTHAFGRYPSMPSSLYLGR